MNNKKPFNTKAFELCETISNNLRLIDSLACLVISAVGQAVDDDEIADTMAVISKLKAESTTANDELMAIIKGGLS